MKSYRRFTARFTNVLALGLVLLTGSPALAQNYVFSDMGGLSDLSRMYSPRGINGPLEQLLFPITHGTLFFPGMQVLPTCPFVSAWMGRHPEYDDLRYRPGDEA